MEDTSHISICVCTYKRPRYLKRLLEKTNDLETDNLFTFSVVVVDNDESNSAEQVAEKMSGVVSFEVKYYHESRRSISYARNKAVRMATGNLIAFIDDDEFPEKDWLLILFKLYKKIDVNGILGPVRPHFESPPPKWLVKSKILERKSLKTEEIIEDSKYTRTGNVLIEKELFAKDEDLFDPAYGLTGGGDAVFFRRMMEKGKIFVWCDEAIVYETVPLERQTRSYHIKRSFTRGMTSAEEQSFFSISTVKSVVAATIYTLALPFLLIAGHHLFMRYFIKDCDHISKLLAYLGINLVKERPY